MRLIAGKGGVWIGKGGMWVGAKSFSAGKSRKAGDDKNAPVNRGRLSSITTILQLLLRNCTHKKLAMAKSKLKTALDAHKGVDYKAQQEKKKRKEAEKRRRTKEQKKAKDTAGEDEEMSEGEEDEEEGGVLIDEEAVGTKIDKTEEQKLQAELKALLGNKKKLMEIDSGSEVDEEEEEEEDEWESAAEEIDGEDGEGEDESEEDDASDDEEQGVCYALRYY